MSAEHGEHGPELAPDERCPSCGRVDPRAAVGALMSRTRARTHLLTSLAGEGLTTAQIADVVTGVRPVGEVLAERDRATPATAPTPVPDSTPAPSAPREDTP
jgi:hypothetical protein